MHIKEDIMKRITLLFIGLLIASISFGQYSNSSTPSKLFFKDNLKYLIHPSFIYSFQNTNYYSGNIEGYNFIDRRYSDEYLLRWTVYPVILDAGISVSRYKIGEEKLNLMGYNLSGSLCLPYNLKLSKYISPYIGIGHQDYFKYNGASTYWQAGIMISMFRGSYSDGLIIINTEYKQSFNPNDPNSFNQFSIGIGLRGEAMYYPIIGIGMGLAYLLGFY